MKAMLHTLKICKSEYVLPVVNAMKAWKSSNRSSLNLCDLWNSSSVIWYTDSRTSECL